MTGNLKTSLRARVGDLTWRLGLRQGWIRSVMVMSLSGVMLAGTAGGPECGSSIGDDLFATQPVWQIQIELTPQAITSLRNDRRQYVPANVRVRGEVIRNVGVHLKGSTGSLRGINDKPSFTLDFEKFTASQSFHGLRKLHLNNSVEDPTYLHEQLGSELFRAAQVPVPRVAHALVELNARKLGLYVLKEGFTEDFLGRHFERTDGNLYDTDYGHDVNLPMKRHAGREPLTNQTDLRRLAAAAGTEPDLARRWDRLQQVLDINRFLNFMAMEIIIGHWDGYCLGQNNFRIYHDPGADRIVFLPTGMDQLFAKADLPWKPDMSGLVARAMMDMPEGRQHYAARFKALLDEVFVSERLTNRVNQLLAELRPFLKKAEFAEIHREAAELCVRIAARESSLRQQLSEPEPAYPEFRDGIASLAGWKAVDEPAKGVLHEITSTDGRGALQIVAESPAAASWRTTVRLNPGRYRFQGEAKVVDVARLPFGRRHGASLRVAGKEQYSSQLVSTGTWKNLETEFEVSAPEEQIVLMCELRAKAGEAWFDKGSLVLVRLPEQRLFAGSPGR